MMLSNTTPADLPTPDPIAQLHSQQLIQRIYQQIQHQGAISFANYMERALYEPGLGYYSAGSIKFGDKGDFITAPEISPWFGQCIAAQCQPVLATIPQSCILEFGAGTGKLAAELLTTLSQLNQLPHRYYILEISAELRQRQKLTLMERCPDLINSVEWLDELPAQPIKGIILANEVLDAMPVRRFYAEDSNIEEYYVNCDGNQFSWTKQPITNETGFLDRIQHLQQHFFGPEPYTSEINLWLPAWLKSLNQTLAQGLVLLIDYGFAAQEYYLPQRNQGTLMCHYRHHSHSDPLILTGLQDITAHVDFSWTAECAHSAGFTIAGYTTQANFLLNCGIDKLYTSAFSMDAKQQVLASQQLQKLLFPHEMGEIFKVMALTNHLSSPLLGFQHNDMRHRL